MKEVDTHTAEDITNIADINTDRPSRRKSDYRAVAALAATMAVEGLRHPVLLMPNGVLLKGGRRIVAARTLGWTTIASRTVDTVEDAVAAIEAAKDEMSVERSIEEWVALGMTIETLNHRDRGVVDDYSSLIGPLVTTSRSSYQRGKALVVASRSRLRPAHIVDAARKAIESYEIGTLTLNGAYARLKAAEKMVPADVVADDELPHSPPPASAARSPKARMLREEWIRALASKGATVEQIAEKLGISVPAVRKICRDINVEVPASVALSRTQRKAADPNRAMRVALDDLDALLWSLDNIDVNALDPAETKEWALRLGRYARGISHASRKIKGVTQ